MFAESLAAEADPDKQLPDMHLSQNAWSAATEYRIDFCGANGYAEREADIVFDQIRALIDEFGSGEDVKTKEDYLARQSEKKETAPQKKAESVPEQVQEVPQETHPEEKPYEEYSQGEIEMWEQDSIDRIIAGDYVIEYPQPYINEDWDLDGIY